MFQSTPRSEERGDWASTSPAAVETSFNPRPAPKNGATAVLLRIANRLGVSIHAPLRRTGRLGRKGRMDQSKWFQSTPRSEERGDPSPCAALAGPRSFNPRPAPKNGATWQSSIIGATIQSFNPRPAPKNGATSQGLIPDCQGPGVSIHAPLRRTGRQGLIQSSSGRRRFQSTPRSEERGDQAYSAIQAYIKVSIHAPLRRTGRRYASRCCVDSHAFQSTPRSEERGDAVPSVQVHIASVFQSTPRSEERGDLGMKPSASSLEFQSTPRSEERGDQGLGGARPGRPGRFNPRPAPKNGATSWFSPALGCRFGCFNPRPAPKNGATPGVKEPLFELLKFQSTPRSEERGDAGAASTGPWASCFNPRPAPKNGATLIFR